MKKAFYILGGAFVIYLIMGINKAFSKPTKSGAVRNCDAFGCGYFGASRGSDREHNGLDFLAKPNEQIFSPITGKITRFPFPYGNDLRWKGIEIKNNEYSIKIFYVNATVNIGDEVKKGDFIATAQNIASKYGSGMQNHIHIEIRDKNNNIIDPTNFF